MQHHGTLDMRQAGNTRFSQLFTGHGYSRVSAVFIEQRRSSRMSADVRPSHIEAIRYRMETGAIPRPTLDVYLARVSVRPTSWRESVLSR
jgi:hypothetical protein